MDKEPMTKIPTRELLPELDELDKMLRGIIFDLGAYFILALGVWAVYNRNKKRD